MPSRVHEIPLLLLKEHPDWLSALLVAVGMRPLPPGVRVHDSALRAEPVTPDLVVGADEGPLVLLELQLEGDERKRFRWPFAVAQIADARGELPDLVVLTASTAVAAWAREIVLTGPLGTRLVLAPVVVHLDESAAELLLAGPPELAFFAAWSMAHRHGKRARDVVTRALLRVRELPPPLRAQEEDAIISVMSPRLAAALKEATMNLDAYITDEAREIGRMLRAREASAVERGMEQGLEKGLARAVIALLAARGVPVDDATRAQITACHDPARLERWAVRAASADRAEDVLTVP